MSWASTCTSATLVARTGGPARGNCYRSAGRWRRRKGSFQPAGIVVLLSHRIQDTAARKRRNGGSGSPRRGGPPRNAGRNAALRCGRADRGLRRRFRLPEYPGGPPGGPPGFPPGAAKKSVSPVASPPPGDLPRELEVFQEGNKIMLAAGRAGSHRKMGIPFLTPGGFDFVFGGQPELRTRFILGKAYHGPADAAHKPVHHRPKERPAIAPGGSPQGEPGQDLRFIDGRRSFPIPRASTCSSLGLARVRLI